jgi:hypothetical protein
LQQVLLHELAHLRRWDDWTNLVQRFLKAILFFHPAVWWMEERISLEREMACDDAVLAETASPRAYAECLATLAEKSFVRRSAALAQAAVNRIRQTTLRVAQILDVNRSKSAPARKSAVALMTAFACACGVIAWRAPQLVGFDDSPPVMAGAVRTAATHQQPVLAAAAAKQRRPEPKVMMARSADVAETQSPPRRRKSEVPRLGFLALEKTRGSPPSLGMTSLSVVVGHEGRAAQVIQARASAENQPRFRTGVVVIFVNDPVFGPTPIFWRYAVWPVAPPRQAEGTPQKIT